jgi:hypothetical protein
MGISTTLSCPMLENRINDFSEDDHQLDVGGNRLGSAFTDGIYGGYPQTNGYPVNFPITLAAGNTVAPNIPAGFAVWLYHAPLPATLTLTHSGNPSGTWYREQRVSNDSVVFWFDVGLDQGETITVSGS